MSGSDEDRWWEVAAAGEPWEVNATVQTTDVPATAGLPKMEGSRVIPTFYVRADTEEQALLLGAEIIDPMCMAPARNIRVRKIGKKEEQRTMTETKIVRINGVPVRIPAEELTDPDTFRGDACSAMEPHWPGAPARDVICTLAPHATGPDGTAHIAHDSGRNVIAIWWDDNAG